MPFLAYAQFDGGELGGYITDITVWINTYIVPAIIALAFLVFIWGVFKFFILGANDEDSRASGRDLMLWGIIGFVVIITIVGIVNLFAGATGLEGEQDINTPTLPNNDGR